MRHVIYIFLFSTMLLGCVKITDFVYSWGGCFYGRSGLSWIRHSKFVGDTLFVYELKYQPTDNDSVFPILKSTLTEAYLKQGRKLYPINNYYPNIYGLWSLEDLTVSEPDSSGIEQFYVNWEGWSDKPAYINYKGVYQKKGKYKELRFQLNQERKSGDSVIWYIHYPREYINDTAYWTPKGLDRLGPLKK